MSKLIIKDPLADLDYNMDWNDSENPWLQDGETIDSFLLTVPSGLTEGASSESGGKVTFWLSSGTDGVQYSVEVKINTNMSRVDERTMLIKVQKRYTEIFLKDPESDLDFATDWNDPDDKWLQTGETIISITVSADTGLTVLSSSETDGKVTAWLSGGTVGTTYDVTVKIKTSVFRIDARRFKIKVIER